MASSSGKMTQPGGACNGTAADFSNVEQELYDYQMHTKMCKKIAQLTKAEEREQKAEEEHAERVAVLTQETIELRRDYENRLQDLESEKVTAQNLLEQTLEENKRLKEECQELLRTRDEEENEEEEKRKTAAENEKKIQEGERKKVEKEYEEMTEALREEVRVLKEEKERLEDERRREEEKMKRRIKELEEARQEEQEAAKRSLQESLSEQISQWQQREQENRKSQNATLQQRLKQIEAELETRELRLNESNRHCSKLQERLEDLEEQLEEGRRRVAEAEGVAKKAEEELAVAKERLLLQENELQNKSEELMSQNSSQVRVCAEVEELRSQLSRLNIRNKELELQNSGRSNDHARMLKQHADTLATTRSELQRAHVEEIRRLQQEVEKERESEKQEVEEEKRRVQQKMEEEKVRLKEQLKKALEEVIRKHGNELRHAHAMLDVERKRAQQAEDLKKTVEDERRSLETEREELHKQLQQSNTEISRLEGVIRQLEKERELEREKEEERERERERLAQELEQQPPCGQECVRLREELAYTHSRLQQTQEELSLQRDSLQAENCALQKEREILEQSQQSLEERIRDQFEQRLSDHVAELQREREEEIREITQHWQLRIQELQTQLEERKVLSVKNDGEREKEERLGSAEMDRMKQEIQRTRELNSTLRAQLHATIQEKERLMKKQQLQVVKEEEEDEDGVREEGKKEAEREERAWREQQEELLRVERLNHQRALQALEAQAQEDLQAERQRLLTQHRLQLEKQKAELTQQHTEWVRQITQRHMQQIEDLQAELHTHTQMMALQQDLKQQNRVQSLERQLDEKGSEMQELRRENDELRERVNTLSVEKERRSLLDSNPSSWTEEDEEALERDGRMERNDRATGETSVVRRDRRMEIQTIISDFSAAQTRLQARIVALETELKERDEKGKRREPRVEDLHTIAKLQDKLTERDQLIKRLVEERHQQSQHPPVCGNVTLKPYDTRTRPGSLTPTLKKVMEETPPRVTSVPNLSSYERSVLNPEGVARGTSRAPGSPTVDQGGRGLPLSRTNTPTSLANPPTHSDPRTGIRYIRSPSQELQHQLHHGNISYTQPIRNPSEQRVLETGPDGQDPQKQEWFTKYFSF
ncbi:protein FAM184B [Chanos chanos]|uniref:Protein FAM184B n=1 Tax=Chanos chanos TaxID=29144 RepID=A0A6J2WKM0_CHACN|nr:protein FAM184B [Chanos chanos]